MEFESTTFANRYTSVWNEPDPVARRTTVAQLWSEDGVEFTGAHEYRGHEELQARVSSAYEQFVGTGEFRFVLVPDVAAHSGIVTFTTQMIPTDGGNPVWSGRIVASLDADGRIITDHQFELPRPTATVVEEFLRRLGDGDPDHIAELFSETVDWQLNWPADVHPAVPWIRPRSTRADVTDHFRELSEFHLPASGGPAPVVLVDGADAVVLGEIRQTVKATRRPYSARYALRLTVVDGLIVRYHVYEDSLSVAEALTGG